MSATRRIVLAAGGTGGHMFPAVAVADELRRRGFAVSLITDARGSGFGDGFAEDDVHRISASGIGGGIAAKIRGAIAIGVGFVQAWRLLGRLQPVCVIGFGGYPSVPTMLATSARRVTSLIHEQNAVLGRANRLVVGKVTAVAASFAETAGITGADADKTVVTGNPVRAVFSNGRGNAYPAIGPNGEGIRILVLGGSQGARIFSDIVPQAFSEMPEPLRRRFAITQQCRPEDLERVEHAYSEAGVTAELSSFFDDVAQRMASAHLVITRSGASTIAELAEAGRPAILVPYPHATDDHQTANARAMEQLGGAWLMPSDAFTADALIARLEGFANLPDTLRDAAASMHKAGGRDAAGALADQVEKLAGATQTGGPGRAASVMREIAA